MPTKPKKPATNSLGYMNVRITKKAYRKIMEQAVKERRTFVATVDVLLGV